MTLMCVEKYKRIGSADDVRTLKREREREKRKHESTEREMFEDWILYRRNSSQVRVIIILISLDFCLLSIGISFRR